jgi:hypothetical protein
MDIRIMRKKNSLWRKNKYGKWYKLKPLNDKVRFIPCDDTRQTYNWQKTNKGSQLNKLK